jgi:uncharacterized membrane protein
MKNFRYGAIVRRIGVILLLTGIVIALVSTFRDFDRLSSSMVAYIWVGLILVGAILLIVFVIDFELKERKLNFNLNQKEGIYRISA